ncbi:MAG TPA: squalene/phytoene synthase family protein [Anaerolineales bacterium]|nr:squalene/phytoene synthase family protein [Anaerolineales bacterium]
MDNKPRMTRALAVAITRAASKQTYYTIRFFVDRELVADAYRAYAYYRWVDDTLDSPTGGMAEKLAFAARQAGLLEALCRGDDPPDLCLEERMLAELVRKDTGENPGLCSYLRDMMWVMTFDAGRRGRLISQAELAEYSRRLACAVTNAMHYFIGHDDPLPEHAARYLAVEAAHITHMLRDALDDVANGYFNIPREVLQAQGISAGEADSQAYRDWVRKRVQLARSYFRAGRDCLAGVKSWRCRLAGYAYTARFEWVLDLIERDGYRLRPEYSARKGLQALLWISWRTLQSLLASPWARARSPRSPGKIPLLD